MHCLFYNPFFSILLPLFTPWKVPKSSPWKTSGEKNKNASSRPTPKPGVLVSWSWCWPHATPALAHSAPTRLSHLDVFFLNYMSTFSPAWRFKLPVYRKGTAENIFLPTSDLYPKRPIMPSLGICVYHGEVV